MPLAQRWLNLANLQLGELLSVGLNALFFFMASGTREISERDM